MIIVGKFVGKYVFKNNSMMKAYLLSATFVIIILLDMARINYKHISKFVGTKSSF